MRAVAIEAFGGRERLTLMDLPAPQAGPGEIRIRCLAAGVNPVDWKTREGMLQKAMPHEFPVILGWDAAGVVDQVGGGVTRFEVGDEVYAYCRKPVIGGGTYAEYVVVPEGCAAAKPAGISFVDAAAVPLAALTAYQALFDAAALRSGETVLIHAGAGGVGTYAIQLAKDRGATVLTTASAVHHEYVKRLGAEVAIDYPNERFEEVVLHHYPHGIDVVFDAVGGQTQLRNAGILSSGSRLVAILGLVDQDLFLNRGIEPHYVFVAPNPIQLEDLTRRIDEGRLKVYVTTILPLEQAAAAHELSEGGHTQGKIVLEIGTE